MKITYKNITVKWYHEDEEFNGACHFDYPIETLNRFLEENEGADFTKNLLYELTEEKERDENLEGYGVYDTDCAIYIFYWMLYECPNDSFELDYYGESPFWLYHDLSHAENDVNGGVLWVDQYIEEQRIFDGLKLLKKNNMLEEFKPQMFESIVKDFRERWNHEIDMKRIIKKMSWKKKDYDHVIYNYS